MVRWVLSSVVALAVLLGGVSPQIASASNGTGKPNSSQLQKGKKHRHKRVSQEKGRHKKGGKKHGRGHKKAAKTAS